MSKTRNIIFVGGPIHLRRQEDSGVKILEMVYKFENQYVSYKKEQTIGGYEFWTCEGSTEDQFSEAIETVVQNKK